MLPAFRKLTVLTVDELNRLFICFPLNVNELTVFESLTVRSMETSARFFYFSFVLWIYFIRAPDLMWTIFPYSQSHSKFSMNPDSRLQRGLKKIV